MLPWGRFVIFHNWNYNWFMSSLITHNLCGVKNFFHILSFFCVFFYLRTYQIVLSGLQSQKLGLYHRCSMMIWKVKQILNFRIEPKMFLWQKLISVAKGRKRGVATPLFVVCRLFLSFCNSKWTCIFTCFNIGGNDKCTAQKTTYIFNR